MFMLMQVAAQKAQALSLSRHQMMLGTQFSNSMDMIGKAGSLRFGRTDTQIQWSGVEASLVVVATAVATAAEVAMVAAAGSGVVEASEGVLVEAVGIGGGHTLGGGAVGLGAGGL